MRGTTPDWSSSEFARLAQLILNSVADGGTVVDGCKEMEKETNGLRSVSACRYKFVIKLSKEYAAEYEVARQLGAKVHAERASNRVTQSTTPSRTRRSNVVRIVPNANPGDESDTPTQITQRDLIRYLRNVKIVGTDSGQVEQLQQQLNDAMRELDDAKHKLMLTQKQLDEVSAERDSMLVAFNVARKHAAGIDSAPKRMVVNGRGELVSVESD